MTHRPNTETPTDAAERGAIGGGRTTRGAASRLWSVPFAIIIAISFFLFVTGQGLNGGLAVYVERIGGTATFAGALSAVFSAAAAITRLALGPVVDARGRMIVTSCGTLALACGTLLAGLVVNDAALVVARIVQGAGFAAATTAVATAAADALPPSRMGEGIGYYGLGQAVAMSFGPALALAILGTDPPQNLFFVLTGTTTIAFALSVACRYERRPSLLPPEAVYRRRAERAGNGTPACKASHSAADKAQSRPVEGEPPARTPARTSAPARGLRSLFEPHAVPGAAPLLLMSAATGFAISFVGLYGERIGILNAGLFFTLSAVSMIAVRVKSKSFMDVTLPITIYGITIACGIAAFALLLLSPTAEPLFYLAGLFYGVFLGLGMPVNQSVAVKNTPPERWGAANALVLLANDIGIGGASLIWGMVNDSLGFSASIIGAICCMAASYAVAWIAYPAEAKRR